MDAIVLGFLLGFSIVLFWLSLKGRKFGWKFVGFLGALLAGMTWLVLSADGNLTIGIATVTPTYTVAAADGNFVSDFNILTWIPGFLSAGELVVTLYRSVG